MQLMHSSLASSSDTFPCIHLLAYISLLHLLAYIHLFNATYLTPDSITHVDCSSLFPSTACAVSCPILFHILVERRSSTLYIPRVSIEGHSASQYPLSSSSWLLCKALSTNPRHYPPSYHPTPHQVDCCIMPCRRIWSLHDAELSTSVPLLYNASSSHLNFAWCWVVPRQYYWHILVPCSIPCHLIVL